MPIQKKLLVVSDGFPQIQSNRYNCNFVKNYVDLVKDEFENVYVISPQPYLPRFLQKRKVLENQARFAGFDDYAYANVQVFYPEFLMLPLESFRRKRAQSFTQKCLAVIKKRALQFDVVHTHFLYPSAAVGIEVGKKYGKPVIATAHGSDTYKEPFENQANLERTVDILKQVDLVTVPSKFMQNKIKQITSFAEKKTRLLPNFVDTEHFFLKSFAKEKQIKSILMVGNLIESKGFLDLIPTVKDLLKKRKDFVVKIIGQGYLYAKLAQMIELEKLEQHIKLLGAKSNDELVPYYHNSDVFFFPSRAESFGIVQIEALACGVPVVAGPNEGSKSILTKDAGFLAEEFQPQEYATLIDQALDYNWNREKMRNYVVKNFSRREIKQKLSNLYKEVYFDK